MARNPVLLVIASEGFQQTEYGETKKVLEAAGLSVKTASNSYAPAIAKDGSTVPVDITIEQVHPKGYAGIFFIGGPGALENLDKPISLDLLRRATNEKIPVGAICIATRILAHAGILSGKRATGWDGDNTLEKIYKDHDVTYIKQDVVVDDYMVTATGPSAAKAFGEAIVTLLKDTKK